jgi:hypothetical protein
MSARRAWPAVAAASRLTAFGANALADGAAGRRGASYSQTAFAPDGGFIETSTAVVPKVAVAGALSRVELTSPASSATTDAVAARGAVQARSDCARSEGDGGQAARDMEA